MGTGCRGSARWKLNSLGCLPEKIRTSACGTEERTEGGRRREDEDDVGRGRKERDGAAERTKLMERGRIEMMEKKEDKIMNGEGKGG